MINNGATALEVDFYKFIYSGIKVIKSSKLSQ